MGVSPNIRLNLVALDVVQTPACFRDYVATTRRTPRYDMTSHDLALDIATHAPVGPRRTAEP